MIEFEDGIDGNDASKFLTPQVRALLWLRWDSDIANKRFKLKWGVFRPSFHWRVFEPVVEKLIGPRP